MNAKRVVLLARRNLWCNPSWITRSVQTFFSDKSAVDPFLCLLRSFTDFVPTNSFHFSFPVLLYTIVDAKNIFCQIYFKNQTPTPGTSFPKHLPLSTVLPLVIDSFTSATERHIEVGLSSISSFISI